MTLDFALPSLLVETSRDTALALNMAYTMLREIEKGNQYDSLDFCNRLSSIMYKLQDLGELPKPTGEIHEQA
jgi:hypothetical protein